MGTSPYTWVIDPLESTSNYVLEFPSWQSVSRAWNLTGCF